MERKSEFKFDPVFRGQGRDYPLIPSLFRLSEKMLASSWEHLEADLLNEFKRDSYPHLECIPSSEVEWVILAQHHGLPTRCLDWTSSLAVALYFAVEDLDEENDGFIYRYKPQCIFYEDVPKLSELFEVDPDVVVYPKRTFTRITGQRACVSMHALPE